MFPGVTITQFIAILRGGLVFDLSAVVYLNLLIILLHSIPFDIRYNEIYQKVMKYIFFIINGIAIAMNGM
ncbi:sulfatase, partial [sediment metagenome]